MAFLCMTSPDREWRSRMRSDTGTPEVDDGLIEVDREDAATGRFLGTHFNSGGLITGICREGSSTSGRIEFDRRVREGGQTFIIHYEGDFIEVSGPPRLRTQNGRYRKVLRGAEGFDVQAQAADEGTWTGEKPLT